MFHGYNQLTVDKYETASVFPSGENKAQERKEGSSCVVTSGTFVKESVEDAEMLRSRTTNLWFSVATICWLLGEKQMDGSTIFWNPCM